MAVGDRERWNDKWAEAGRGTSHGSALVDLVRPWLPYRDPSSTLPVAVRATRCTSRLGLDVTVADVSDVGLIQATQRCLAEDLKISTIEIDLETESIPAGRWDVITVANYLQRDLFESLVDHLAEDGVIGVVIATETNLERNERPSRGFLLDRRELPALIPGVETLHVSESWRDNGRHEAHFVGRRR